MKNTPYTLNVDKLTSLFLIFVLATGSILIRFLFPLSNEIIKQVLFYFGFFGYGFVILSILFYYIAKVNAWLKKDEIRIGATIGIILALSHSIFIGVDNQSWWSFLGYLAGDGLIIFIGLFSYKKWQKNKKLSSKKLK